MTNMRHAVALLDCEEVRRFHAAKLSESPSTLRSYGVLVVVVPHRHGPWIAA